MEKRPNRSDEAISAIDRGLRLAEDITVADGIKSAVEAGRMSIDEGKLCLEAYQRTRRGLSVSSEASEEAAAE